MEIILVCVGKLRTAGTRELYEEYARRIGRFCKFRTIEIPEAASRTGTPQQAADAESENILKKLGDIPFILCEPDGDILDSPEFAAMLERETGNSRRLGFVVGGSDGVSPAVRERARRTVSFSRLTFPHQLFRGVLAEQIYRAFTIMKNHPYHK